VGGVVDLLGSESESQANSAFRLCERGVSVRSGDSEGLARGLEYLIENEDLRRSLGERGRDFVTRNYGKERLLRDISGLYAELLRGAGSTVEDGPLDPAGTGQDHYRARLNPRS
jgi:glycosyltransferase involved in cell wall biosynthesis